MALIEFYGNGCMHCERMAPIVERLVKEGVAVEQKEVWENQENAEVLAEYDKGLCGGVPFFINTETKSFICGEASYEELKLWATGG